MNVVTSEELDRAEQMLPLKRGERRFTAPRVIQVRGAREHNLKSIDIDIPRDRLTVITGLSGSGKSSLAFDTIFAEGQRKYIESLSAYARQFLDQLKKPDVDSIEGLPPTLAIEQRSSGHNPRSTVATTTEIYDYLRLLFARVGKAECWHVVKTEKGTSKRCGQPISRANASQITEAVSQLPNETKLLVLAPIIRSKKGYHRDLLEQLLKQGFVRARVNGEVINIEEKLQTRDENPLKLGRYEQHTIEAVVDRLVVKSSARKRLNDSIETALKLGNGTVIISKIDGETTHDTFYSEHFACSLHPECALEELEPRLFSFNSHYGACDACQGLGVLLEFDTELILPDEDKPIGQGGIAPWKKNGPGGMIAGYYLRRFYKKYGVDRSTLVSALSEKLRHALLYGEGETGRDAWPGVIPVLNDWFQNTESQRMKEFLQPFMGEKLCQRCYGDRLNEKALSVFVTSELPLPDEVLLCRVQHGLSTDANKISIADMTQLNIATALRIIESLKLTTEQTKIAAPIVREIKARLGFLESVGLEYLSLNRKTSSLSGGEAQRIRLATQVGSGIVGAAYVLDEPTIGLHPRDNTRLINTLRHLADIGNTVIIVEHDEEMIRAADHVVDIGPGPGVHGGTVVAQGSVEAICKVKASITGQYLSRALQVKTPKSTERRSVEKWKAIVIEAATENNLKGIDVAIPLGGLVCVTGVSGSGKSTLVNDILLNAAKRHLHQSKIKAGAHRRVTGFKQIERVIEVDQSPIGRTPRSNPATYTGVFDEIRQLFTLLPEARARGYSAGRFSFNVKGGRCEACEGQGVKKIAMHFLPDVFVTCEVCKGSRYNRETCEVTFHGKSIADVLGMTIEDAAQFFQNIPKIARGAECLIDVGLGYIQLGQPSTTLSGGEAQRVKLATELAKGQSLTSRVSRGHGLYILDEPTTGLHFADVHRLIHVLNRLADQDNTVVVIEHNLDVIKSADWIIDLGPEGGDRGGTLVAEGTPEQIAKHKKSYTGNYLRQYIAQQI